MLEYLSLPKFRKNIPQHIIPKNKHKVVGVVPRPVDTARTCGEAIAAIVNAVDDEVDLGPVGDSAVEELVERDERALLDMFMFAAHLFAVLVSECRFIRPHMGIRRGILG